MAANDLRISQSGWFQGIIQTNSGDILDYIDNHSGCTNDEIATGTSINIDVVDEVVRILEQDSVIVITYDESGIQVFWGIEDWTAILKSKISAARTWVDTHNNGLASEMAVDISVLHEVAIQLAWQLDYEQKAKVTYITG